MISGLSFLPFQHPTFGKNCLNTDFSCATPCIFEGKSTDSVKTGGQSFVMMAGSAGHVNRGFAGM
jgi:hypothetical protein